MRYRLNQLSQGWMEGRQGGRGGTRGVPSLLSVAAPTITSTPPALTGPPMSRAPSGFIYFPSSPVLSTHVLCSPAEEANRTDKAPVPLELTFWCR